MSEEIPDDSEVTGEPKGRPRKGAKPPDERETDMARLAQLQKDYEQLRDQLRQAPTPAAGAGAEALARKSEAAREIVALRQKHNLA